MQYASPVYIWDTYVTIIQTRESLEKCMQLKMTLRKLYYPIVLNCISSIHLSHGRGKFLLEFIQNILLNCMGTKIWIWIITLYFFLLGILCYFKLGLAFMNKMHTLEYFFFLKVPGSCRVHKHTMGSKTL